VQHAVRTTTSNAPLALPTHHACCPLESAHVLGEQRVVGVAVELLGCDGTGGHGDGRNGQRDEVGGRRRRAGDGAFGGGLWLLASGGFGG
jgi:hypothetical protein